MKPISIKLVIVSLLAAARLVYAGATAETEPPKPALAVWSKLRHPLTGLIRPERLLEKPTKDWVRTPSTHSSGHGWKKKPQALGDRSPTSSAAFDLLDCLRIEESGVSRRSTSRGLRVTDHFLASPHFGERWGRHWLDLRATRTATVTSYTSATHISIAIG